MTKIYLQAKAGKHFAKFITPNDPHRVIVEGPAQDGVVLRALQIIEARGHFKIKIRNLAGYNIKRFAPDGRLETNYPGIYAGRRTRGRPKHWRFPPGHFK